MDWIEVRVHVGADAEEAVCYLLQSHGAEGTAIYDSAVLRKEWDTPFGEWYTLSQEDYPAEGVWISAYFPKSVYPDGLAEKLEKEIRGLSRFGLNPEPAQVMTRRLAEESWEQAWKAYYKPLRVTSRLTVKPRWETYHPESSTEAVIELDPGMAFGTGTHPTTILSMQLLEQWLQPGAQVVDVGCGSGILSIAAAKLGAAKVTALDLDPVAVEKAQENVDLNGESHRIAVRQNDLLHGFNGEADLVVANILAEIIVKLVPDLRRVLERQGTFLASGIIREKEEVVAEALQQHGFQVVETLRDGDWVALAART
ncbi:50S ribosomal protein L11 methyltransferase [Desmospora activa]|uniref:Ribosomal protein L11 methyltransferase n=1 Tax=Desmospora activa DSM 45169 TaxID=1121389 RepID=A0A2T4ZC97_9BACL|nr:50S ribosomal protein L11 methyltransferase [Desmospora activa]PTM59499.1 [LSU ribosomal protein L11P]-lysine N-methyltransferase [Desmospora activa DSM 45169]